MNHYSRDGGKVSRKYRKKIPEVLQQLEDLYLLLKHPNYREFAIAYKVQHDLDCIYQVAVRLYEMGFTAIMGWKGNRTRLMLNRGKTRRDWYSGKELMTWIRTYFQEEETDEVSEAEPEPNWTK